MGFKNILLRYLPITIILFSLAIFLGIEIAQIFPELGQETLRQLMEKFAPIKDQNSLTIFLFIFFNNSLVDLLAILSFFVFGLGAIFIVLSNGFIIGLVLNIFLQEEGTTKVAAALLPHGLIEIPAFLLAAAVGLWLGVQFLAKLFHQKPFKPSLILSLKFFLKIILPLNFLAALIETFLTPLIYSQF